MLRPALAPPAAAPRATAFRPTPERGDDADRAALDELRQRLGRKFTVERTLRSETGTVYVCSDGIGWSAAIKSTARESFGSTSAYDAFLATAASWAKLGRHPNIVELQHVWAIDSRPFLLMEAVRGEDLGKRLQKGRLSQHEIAAISSEVACGMDFAWNRERLIHQDLKPQNVLLGKAAQISDFGCARVVDIPDQTAQQATGTPRYMAPEQFSGPVDQRADIYAFGLVVYEMLAGLHAFPEAMETIEVWYHHLEVVPAPIESVRGDTPRWLSTLVARCIEKDPNRRPKDWADVVAAFHRREPA